MADKIYCQLSVQKSVLQRMKYRGNFLTAVTDIVQMSKISTALNLKMRAELESAWLPFTNPEYVIHVRRNINAA